MFKRKRKKKYQQTGEQIIANIFSHPSNSWTLQSKHILRPLMELFDHLSLSQKQGLEKGGEIIFQQVSGQFSCTVQQPPNAHVILLFPELIRLLTSVNNARGLAILAHELGHIYHQHHKKNLPTLEAQIEADDFAYHAGLGHDLVEVLLSYRDIDSQTRVSILTSKIISERQTQSV